MIRALLFSQLAVAYQAFVSPLLEARGSRPDLTLLALSVLALQGSARQALLGAAGAGLVVDALSLDPPGTHLVAFLLAAGLLLEARRAGLCRSPALRALALGIALAAGALARGTFLWALEGSPPPGVAQAQGTLWTWILAWPFSGLLRSLGGLIAEPGRSRWR